MASKEPNNQLHTFLSQALINYRVEHNIKQKELAEKLCIDDRTLRRWESGQVSQRVEDLKRIADMLGIEYEQLGLSHTLSSLQTLEQIDAAIEQGWTYSHRYRLVEGRAFAEKLVSDLTFQLTSEDHHMLERLARARHVAGYIISQASRTKKVPDALHHYHEMEKLARLLKDDALLNIALTYQGDMLRWQGKLDEAITYLEAACDVAPDAETKGNAVQLLARVHFSKGDIGEFENAMAEAKDLSLAPHTGITNRYYCLGSVYEEYGKSYGWMGQTQKGLDYLDLAQKEVRSGRHWNLVLKTARAMTLVRGGDVTNGGQLAIEAAQECHRTNGMRMLERVYLIENHLEQKTSEYDKVASSLREALRGPIEHL